MAADLFVSYARTDRDQVLPWVQRLQQAGVSLWMDEADLDAASLWTGEITEAIDGCHVLLLILSPASVASRQVAREIALASEGSKPILPLLLEPTTITGPLRYHLADVQHLKLFGADPEKRLPAILRALARLGVVPLAPQESPGETEAVPAPAPSPPQERAPNNLPQALTSFIGREKEIDAVKERLAGTRLLTLTGSGGTGKTRLALQVAADLVEASPDGVWLVELAALSDPALVTQEVGRALGVRAEPGRSLIETLLDALRARQLLLVLDNCEHLVAACADLAHALLRACPGVRLLATSREALGVPGETVWRVPSLAVPQPPPPPLEQLTQYEAVRLFIERSVLSQPSFAVTNENAPAVAGICQRLEGIPLAIELAAARVKLLAVEQIMARLDDRFRLLTGGSRTVLPRQQTLRAAIDWSFDLLTEPERVLLRRLSVFAGRMTLDAAEAICADDAVEACQVLDLLGQLVEKSLLEVEEEGDQARYHLLETLRQYGAEKLQGSGEEVALRDRHRDWFLGLAEAAEPHLRELLTTVEEREEQLKRLQRGHDDLRAALAWSGQREDTEALLRLAGALSRFWAWQNYWEEGRRWLERALQHEGDVPAAVRAKALSGAGELAWAQGDWAAAAARWQECLALFRELDDPRRVAETLDSLGYLRLHRDDLASAGTLFEESLAIRRRIDDRQNIAQSLINLGNVALNQGALADARSCYEESLAIWRELGDKGGIARALASLGSVFEWQGDYSTARSRVAEGLAVQRELGDQRGIAGYLCQLGLVLCEQGETAPARSLFEESLTIHRALGDKDRIVYSQRRLALVAAEQGEYEAADSLLRAALETMGEMGGKLMIFWLLKELGELHASQGALTQAREFCEESLALAQQIGVKWWIAWSLDALGGVMACEGDFSRARTLREESLAILQELGSPYSVASALCGLGEVALKAGDYATACERSAESLAIGRKLGMKPVVADALDGLGKATSRQGEHARAAGFCRESLALRREMEDRRGMAPCLEGLAGAAAAAGEAERAARVLGAAEALREALGRPLPPVERADYEREVGAVRAALGEKAFAAAWAAGRAMTLEQVITDALEPPEHD
jgi:predicted ATPase